MSNAELIKYLFDSSNKDWGIALVLLQSKKYMYTLFFCHLSLEKYIKGIIVRNGGITPITHDLLLLAEKAKIKLTDKQAKLLYDVNAFNIKTRYDDYKNSFYKRATALYTKQYIKEINEFKIWLKKQ
ncbi:MAG: HEPN domain-containing protein [bacterium]|nr:HEPN domain-containing protein [bacterium]